jgi:hypothetical protein
MANMRFYSALDKHKSVSSPTNQHRLERLCSSRYFGKLCVVSRSRIFDLARVGVEVVLLANAHTDT